MKNKVNICFKQETTDNEIAVQKGLKPYTLLTVEITDGTGDKSGFIGWYYVCQSG